MNTWTFIGNLGKDAIINVTDGGRNVINFNVAITEKFKNKQGVLTEVTTWVSCAKWGEKTAVAEYLTKGTMVCVTGRPTARAYQGAGGEIHAQLNVMVDTVDLLVVKKQGAGINEQPVTNVPIENVQELEDDLPF